jgi:hypothetical protein
MPSHPELDRPIGTDKSTFERKKPSPTSPSFRNRNRPRTRTRFPFSRRVSESDLAVFGALSQKTNYFSHGALGALDGSKCFGRTT